MLSTIFLSFEDREMRLTFEKEKKAYYGRILLVIWPILILLTAALIVLDSIDEYDGKMETHIVNGVSVVVFFLMLNFLLSIVVAAFDEVQNGGSVGFSFETNRVTIYRTTLITSAILLVN